MVQLSKVTQWVSLDISINSLGHILAIEVRFVAHGLLFDNNNLLLLRRRAGRYLGGQWDPPGGLVNEGETPQEAVVREFWEETGLSVSVYRKLAEQRNLDTAGRPIEFVTVTYQVEPSRPSSPVHLNPLEHDSYDWVTLADVATRETVWWSCPILCTSGSVSFVGH